jgi:hypothetical protein
VPIVAATTLTALFGVVMLLFRLFTPFRKTAQDSGRLVLASFGVAFFWLWLVSYFMGATWAHVRRFSVRKRTNSKKTSSPNAMAHVSGMMGACRAALLLDRLMSLCTLLAGKGLAIATIVSILLKACGGSVDISISAAYRTSAWQPALTIIFVLVGFLQVRPLCPCAIALVLHIPRSWLGLLTVLRVCVPAACWPLGHVVHRH